MVYWSCDIYLCLYTYELFCHILSYVLFCHLISCQKRLCEPLAQILYSYCSDYYKHPFGDTELLAVIIWYTNNNVIINVFVILSGTQQANNQHGALTGQEYNILRELGWCVMYPLSDGSRATVLNTTRESYQRWWHPPDIINVKLDHHPLFNVIVLYMYYTGTRYAFSYNDWLQ